MRRFFLPSLFLLTLSLHAADRHVLTADDFPKLRDVSAPQISPDGHWVAYSVRSSNMDEDRRSSDLYMTKIDGTSTIRLTSTAKESENSPRWSPDGRYLAFLSSREDEKELTQLWLLDRRGGEAQKISEAKGSISDYVWSPDGSKIVFVADDPDPNETDDKDEKKTPKPIVIDRYYFKEDITGYLGAVRQHLYLLDVESKKSEALTSGAFNEYLPAYSPDGKTIAFVSKRADDFDRDDNWDLFLMEAKAGATPRQLTTFAGTDNDPNWESRPAFSPDGKSIAYLQGGTQELIYYAVRQLAVIAVDDGKWANSAVGATPQSAAGMPLIVPRLLTSTVDRNITFPQWSHDGKSIYFVLEDDRGEQLARISASGGAIERLTPHEATVNGYDIGGTNDQAVVQLSTTAAPNELFVVEKSLRPLTHENRELFESLQLGKVEAADFKSPDGTMVGGFITYPPNYVAGTKYPTILRIHGGPVSQFSHQFSFEWQLLAANGYVVVAANPRGSSGRGLAWSKAIYADWGNKDTQDVLAAVDHVVKKGIADPNRLGVGGWSYGGILTNYVIASTTRFKAATSGASISNVLAGYGTDMYIREYEAELGAPWKHPDVYAKLSYPFLHADRIKTPTLFLCGAKDFNVPLLNSEQMYQALRSLSVPTQLVIYPEQFHGLTKPSYLKDRYERYVAWYAKYLGAGPDKSQQAK